ncbi:MAG: hypothetical protein ABI934_05580 [Actinomycetota bacterium]
MSIEAKRGAERGLVVAGELGGLGAVSIEAKRGAERGLVVAEKLAGLGAVSIEAKRGIILAIGNSGLGGSTS